MEIYVLTTRGVIQGTLGYGIPSPTGRYLCRSKKIDRVIQTVIDRSLSSPLGKRWKLLKGHSLESSPISVMLPNTAILFSEDFFYNEVPITNFKTF